MAQKLSASMPDLMDLGASYEVQVTALSPTTGALVTGVADAIVIGDVEQLTTGPFMLVPGPNE